MASTNRTMTYSRTVFVPDPNKNVKTGQKLFNQAVHKIIVMLFHA